MSKTKSPRWALPQTGGRLDYRYIQLNEAKKAQRQYSALRSEILWHPSALARWGWYRSNPLALCNSIGAPLPWLCYPAIAWLEKQIKPNWHVAEWGSGSSSLWWATRVARLECCEHDQTWYQHSLARARPNMQVHYHMVKSEDYLNFVRNLKGPFDAIIIDGKRRVACTKRAIEALKPNGLLIFDDAQKVRFFQAWRWLEKRNFKRLDFWGPKALQPYAGKTSIFSKKNLRLC